MSLIISRVIFHYFLYLSNIIILHEVHLLSNYTFPTQDQYSKVLPYRHWKILLERSPPFCCRHIVFVFRKNANCCRFPHDVTKIQTKKLSILPRFQPRPQDFSLKKWVGVPAYKRREGITFSYVNSTHISNLRGKIFLTAFLFTRSTENTSQVTALKCIAAKPAN